MKKILLLLALFTGTVVRLHAQDNSTPPAAADDNKQERLQALYVAYITKELNLTADEAQKFWPIHAEFDKEIKGVKPELPELDKQQTVLNIKKKYQEKFTKVLGAPRTETFFRKDGEFRRILIDKLRKMRQNRPLRNPALRRGQ